MICILKIINYKNDAGKTFEASKLKLCAVQLWIIRMLQVIINNSYLLSYFIISISLLTNKNKILKYSNEIISTFSII